MYSQKSKLKLTAVHTVRRPLELVQQQDRMAWNDVCFNELKYISQSFANDLILFIHRAHVIQNSELRLHGTAAATISHNISQYDNL